MTTTTLRPLLEQRPRAAGAYRRFVSSGLDNFRMLVAEKAFEAGGVVCKYICCDGACPGAPSTAPGPSAPVCTRCACGDAWSMLVESYGA